MLFGVQKNQTRDKNIFLEKKIIKCTHKTPKQQNTKTMFNLVYEKNLLNRHINRNTYIFKKKRLHVLFIITPARLFESYKFFHFRMHRPNFQSCMKINFNTKSNFLFLPFFFHSFHKFILRSHITRELGYKTSYIYLSQKLHIFFASSLHII